MAKRTIAYIDGFNLYHSIVEEAKDLNEPALKWVNLWSLSASLLSSHEKLEAVRYFSAYATHRPESYKRHRLYVKRLKEAGVIPHMAHFKKKSRKCFACKNTWTSYEEKESDVHLALKLFEDAVDDNFDTALIFSADSDLVPALATVKQRFPEKKVVVIVTRRRRPTALGIIAAADYSKVIRPGRLRTHIFDGFNPYAGKS